MNLYHVRRLDDIGYDEHSAFVCAAHNADEARAMHPYGDCNYDHWENEREGYGTWLHPDDLHKLDVQLIGTATGAFGETAHIILADFRAG